MKSIKKKSGHKGSINLNNSTSISRDRHDQDVSERQQERIQQEIRRRQHKLYAESQKESRLAHILQLQETYEKQTQEVKSIAAGDVSDLEESSTGDSDECSDVSYPPTSTQTRFSWIDSMTSSLNSSFTSQSRLIIDNKEERQVEGRIKTEELVLKVHEALRKVQLKPSLEEVKEIYCDSEKIEPFEVHSVSKTKITEKTKSDYEVAAVHDSHTIGSNTLANTVTSENTFIQPRLTFSNPNTQEELTKTTITDTSDKTDIELYILEKTLYEQREMEGKSNINEIEYDQIRDSHSTGENKRKKPVCCIIL